MKHEDFSNFRLYPTLESMIQLHQDAARYRWLRASLKETEDITITPEILDKMIDEHL
jgi:hypothetical protein